MLRSDAKPSAMCPRGYPCEAMKDQSVRRQCRWLHVATEAEPRAFAAAASEIGQVRCGRIGVQRAFRATAATSLQGLGGLPHESRRISVGRRWLNKGSGEGVPAPAETRLLRLSPLRLPTVGASAPVLSPSTAARRLLSVPALPC